MPGILALGWSRNLSWCPGALSSMTKKERNELKVASLGKMWQRHLAALLQRVNCHCSIVRKEKKHECPQPAGPAPSQQRPVSSAWIGATTLPRRHRPRRHRSASLCMQRSAFLLCTSTCRARRGGRSWQQSMQEQDDWILSSNRSLIALATSRGEMHLVSWRSWQLQLLS